MRADNPLALAKANTLRQVYGVQVRIVPGPSVTVEDVLYPTDKTSQSASNLSGKAEGKGQEEHGLEDHQIIDVPDQVIPEEVSEGSGANSSKQQN